MVYFSNCYTSFCIDCMFIVFNISIWNVVINGVIKMKTFEQMGYQKKHWVNNSIRFIKVDDDCKEHIHVFNLKRKTYQKRVDGAPKVVTVDELTAIFDVCKELGWIE